MRSRYKPFTTVLVACLGLFANSKAQNILTGIVRDEVTGIPVTNLNVSTTFGLSCITDRFGQYKLPLPTGAFKPGDFFKLITFSPEYGYFESDCIISTRYNFDFRIPKNSLNLTLSGGVRDAATKAEIAGIELSPVIDNVDMEAPVDTTDRFGRFVLPLNKKHVRDNQYVHLMVRDPSNRYRPPGGNPITVKMGGFTIVELQANSVPMTVVKINGSRQTGIYVRANDFVVIEATGSIKLGTWVGHSSPEGKEAGVFGMSLEGYNIVRQFNHGALMYRFAGDKDWKLVGRRVEFTADKSGYLEFQVNDNQPGDNEGEFQISVTVQHR